MYWLQLYNFGPDGEPTAVVQVVNPLPLAVAAIAGARRLSLASHFRITCDSGEVLWKDAV